MDDVANQLAESAPRFARDSLGALSSGDDVGFALYAARRYPGEAHRGCVSTGRGDVGATGASRRGSLGPVCRQSQNPWLPRH